MAEIAASLRALLAQSIDYAGLFPPASLELRPALENFVAGAASNESWMLSAFVLPVTKFSDAACLISRDDHNSLIISALGTKTVNAIDFSVALKTAVDAVRVFLAQYGNMARVTQLEMPLPSALDARVITSMREILGDLLVRTFWETPADDAEQTIAALAEQNAQEGAKLFGYKLRTGGVIADAFPSSAQVATALVAAAKHRVPIKFTAGLHHPVRMFRQEVSGAMHGFLNVLGAGVLAIEHRWDVPQTTAMLEDEEPGEFQFSGDVFRWREFEVSAEKIEKHRTFITSFGSCSFDEPRDDLRAFGLL